MSLPRLLSSGLVFFGTLLGWILPLQAEIDDEGNGKPWIEQEVRFPNFPKATNLLPFFVSAATDNRFFVDSDSVSVGADGVVRYTLVVETAGGARNVSFEGMRCVTKEFYRYAFGRSDATWSKAKTSQWERVQEASGNRHHAALFQDYFCPGGVVVNTAAEAIAALKRGDPPSFYRY